MAFTGLLNTVVNLERVTETNDNVGGVTKAWASQGSIKCRISPISANESVLANKVYQEATHVVYCGPVDVRENDRLAWGDWEFDVIGITNPSEAYHHLQIYVKEIT